MERKFLETRYVPLVKLHAVKEKFIPYGNEELYSPERVVRMAGKLLEGMDRECVLAIPIDACCKPVGVEIVSIGSVKSCQIQARELYKYAILSSAYGLIMVHNHVSGKIEPSQEDYAITKKMREAGRLLDIDLIDHIIIGDDGSYFSMNESEKWNNL